MKDNLKLTKKRKSQRLGATAVVLLMLDACGTIRLTEEVLHSLGYLVQSQMRKECYPRMSWEINANFIHSKEIAKGLMLARKQGLVAQAPSVALTSIGKKHCELLELPENGCRFDLMQASVATIGLAKDNLHWICIAAAALASGYGDQITDENVRSVIRRHSKYITRKVTL
jgi:hypothetical protein